MGCFRDISIRNNYPWKCMRKSSSKIWRKVLRKNRAIYSVHRAFLREDEFRESKYSRLRTEDNKQEETMENCKGEETGVSRVIALEESTEKDGKSTIDNTVGQDITGVTENIVVDSNRIVDNSITSNMGDFATTSSTQCDSNSIDSISVGGERVIVEVQLETSKMSYDQQEICDDKEQDGNQLKRIPDEKITQTENDSQENDEYSFGDQVETEMLNESHVNDSNTNLNSENSMTRKNEFKNEPSLKIDDENSMKTENEIQSPTSVMISKFSPSHTNENKENESNVQYETTIKAKIRIFQNKHTQLDYCNMTENEKYKDSRKETDCSSIGLQKSDLEIRTEKLSKLVKLYEKQATPSPIHKITSAIIHHCHHTKNKMEEDKNVTVGAEKCDIIPTTVSSLNRTKRKNHNKENDLFEYSSVSSESLMAQIDDFSSLNQQKWNPDNRKEIDSIIREIKTVEDKDMHNIPAGSAEPTECQIKITNDEKEGFEDSTSDHKSVNGGVQLQESETKRIGLRKDQDLKESSTGNLQLEASRENNSVNSISDFLGLVEAREDSSFNSDSLSDEARHRNISSSSVYDLSGLTETRVDTTVSTNADSGRYTPSRNESYETGTTGQSEEMDEITIEVATLDRNRTRRDAKGRIPSFKMSKFETLFRKSSLKKLYKMMEKSHKKSRVLETPLDDLTQAKFIMNCYGPSIRKKEICKWPLCST